MNMDASYAFLALIKIRNLVANFVVSCNDSTPARFSY